jgi:hypothetical protein
MEKNRISSESAIYCLVKDCIHNNRPSCNLKIMGVGLDGKCTGLAIVKTKKKDK